MQKYKQKKNKLVKLIILLGIILFVFVFTIIAYKVSTVEKFIYINKSKNLGAEIIIIDTKSDNYVKYTIPPETEFDSARGYGTYKLSSLWTLSETDTIKGKLVAETISKNLFLPVYLWKDENESNLTITQKLKSIFIEKKIANDTTDLNIKNISNSVFIDFIDASLENNDIKITVNDLTGSVDTIQTLSKLIEVSGSKITSNSKGYDENLDCKIEGSDTSVVVYFSKILDCEKNIISTPNNELVITLGAKFTSRF